MAIDKKKLFYRLKFYGLGFGLGCVAVWATLYNGRDERSSWMPEGRVLEFLERTDIAISDDLKCQLECEGISENFMDSTFWANAAVDFEKSATKRKPCPEHYIESTLKDGRQVSVFVENCETCFDCEGEGVASLRSFDNITQKEIVCDC
ncbi:MAG: hypothetical protein QMB65_13930 [Vicingaceae bacterium]|jgi:hypothetical protein